MPPHQQHQQMPPQQHSNMPYYDHTMNMMNPGMATGPSGYHDGTYHEMQSNRYEKLNQFTINHTSRPFTWNNYYYDKILIDIQLCNERMHNLALLYKTITIYI